ncbi:endonuclease domain-containing protein [Candidatus Peregrinibacteria bacterium]|nr:endonuclease domain-containing protein [Candidatus Peregrinibacteria bacterium]
MKNHRPTKRLPHSISFARTLRTNQTTIEKIIWKQLRARRFHHLKFRRQVPIGPYIADFYCAEHNLIIEIDGGVHALQQKYDCDRDTYLRKNGYTLIRINNSFVKEWSIETLEKIGRAVGINYENQQPSL